jgi:hypothetical protein
MRLKQNEPSCHPTFHDGQHRPPVLLFVLLPARRAPRKGGKAKIKSAYEWK